MILVIIQQILVEFAVFKDVFLIIVEVIVVFWDVFMILLVLVKFAIFQEYFHVSSDSLTRSPAVSPVKNTHANFIYPIWPLKTT